MDPNTTVAEIRENARALTQLVEGWIPGEDVDRDASIEEHILKAEELFSALDEWLRKGGFLPATWAIPGERG